MSEGTADSPEVASISINVTAGDSLAKLRDEIAALGGSVVDLRFTGAIPPKDGGGPGSNTPQFKMPVDLEQTLQKLDQSIVAQTLAIKSMVDGPREPGSGSPGTPRGQRRKRKQSSGSNPAVDEILGIDSEDGGDFSPLDPGVAKVKAGYEKLSVDALKMAHGWRKRAANKIIKDFKVASTRMLELSPATNATQAIDQSHEIDKLFGIRQRPN